MFGFSKFKNKKFNPNMNNPNVGNYGPPMRRGKGLFKKIGIGIVGGGLAFGGFSFLSTGNVLGLIKTNLFVTNPSQGVAEVNKAVGGFANTARKIGEDSFPAGPEGKYTDSYEHNMPEWIKNNRFEVLSDFDKFKGPYLLFIFNDVSQAETYKSQLENAMKNNVKVRMLWTRDVQKRKIKEGFLYDFIFRNYTVKENDDYYGKVDGGMYQSLTLIDENNQAVVTSQREIDSKSIIETAIKLRSKQIEDNNNYTPPELPYGLKYPDYKKSWEVLMVYAKELKENLSGGKK